MLYIHCPAPRIVHMGWWSKTGWAPRLRSPSKWCCIIKMMCKPCFGEPQKRKIWHFLKSNNRSGLQSGPWVAWPESTGSVFCPAPQICLLENRNVENWYLGRNLHTEVFRHPCPSGSWPCVVCSCRWAYIRSFWATCLPDGWNTPPENHWGIMDVQ